MTEPTALMKPTALGRFVVWLENAGYARCFDEDAVLGSKDYWITKFDREFDEGQVKYAAVVTLQGQQGSCEFHFNERGQLVGHDVLE